MISPVEGPLAGQTSGASLSVICYFRERFVKRRAARAPGQRDLRPNLLFGPIALRFDQPQPDAAPYLEDTKTQTGETLVVRTFLCPNCGDALDAEPCRAGSVPHRDFRLLPN
jgi:hypothetical protein